MTNLELSELVDFIAKKFDAQEKEGPVSVAWRPALVAWRPVSAAWTAVSTDSNPSSASPVSMSNRD